MKAVAAEDADADQDADVTLAHAISSADDTDYHALADQSVTVSITENDAVGVTINPTSLTVTEGDADGASYTVTLTSQPAGDVTVTVSGHSGTDLTLSSTGLSNDNKLTFTSSNWGEAQTVTVKAAEDVDAVADADVTLAHAISSTDDSDYHALADQSVTVSITENDVAGVTIDPTSLTVTEGDAAGASYTVVLTSQPAGDVTIAISGHAGTDLTLSGTSLSNDEELTFTTENWGTAQTVKAVAAEDADAVADADVTLAHEISSTDDTAYHALADQSVTVSITENDAVGVSIDPTSLTVTEGDAAGASYAVTLTSQPAGDVTIAISGHSGTDLTLSGTTLTNNVLTFTTENWSTVQTVTVKAAEDGDADQDADVTLVHAMGSADDSDYHALADQSVTVSITENDVAGVTVTFEKEIHYTIEGASGAAGVEVLLSAPLATEVTIPITVLSESTADTGDYLVDDHAGYASDPGLTFSPGETFGYVLIKAVLDTVDENTETVVLRFGTLPAGVSEGSPSRSTVEIKDAIQVSFADSSYMVEEGGAGVEVVVKLNKPRNNLRVPLTANGHGGVDDSDFTGVPQEVVFKGDETEETFTFVAMEDSEEENGEMVRLGFGAFSEGIVAIFPDSAIVMIFDDDAGAPAPRHFAAYWPTQTSITLSWFTVETAAEYKLEFRKHGESDWIRISGDFDHLPSTSDHRDAFGVAAGLDCETQYDFRVSARGDGSLRNDGSSYPSTLFGSAATTSAQTGECAQEERVTNLLVSVEPRCATLTWTPPSGNRDTGYRVERYSYTDNRNHRSEPETLTEQANRVAARYEDCSAEYRTDGAEHEYIVTALDNNPEPDEEGAFGTAYTAILVFGPNREPEGPRNVRLTRDTQSSRRLAWDAPRDPWLTTVRTARDGSGPQQVVTDPWTTGYRVERHEYRRTEDGGWFLPEFVDETLLTATMTVGEDSSVSQRGYSPDINGPYGELTQTVFTLSSGSYTVIGLYHPTDGGSLRLTISPRPPSDAPEDWILVIDGVSLPLEDGIIGPDGSLLLVTWFGQSLSWAVGQQVSAQLVERSDWKVLRYGAVDDTGTSFTDSEDKGDRQYVYRVWAYNNRGLSRYSWRGDWAFNGGDPGGDPEPAGYVPPPPAQQQGGKAPSNTPATGAPAISGTPQVDETLTASTSDIADEDGLTNVSYSYQWIRNDGTNDADIADQTGSTYTLVSVDQGNIIKVQVSFTDDANNQETLPSEATVTVTPAPNRDATGAPNISGTPQVEQTLTADTSGISDANGLNNVSYQYQWLRDDADIAGQTNSTYTLVTADQGKTIRVRVTFTDDAGNAESLTSAATTAVAAQPAETPVDLLTASFANVPADHNGSNFTFQLTFSENVEAGYARIRDHAFTIDGATIDSASRITQGSNQGWNVEVDPAGNGSVTITLPETTDCDASGAICTDDSRKLSHPTSAIVAGPPAISVHDATVQEAEGAVLVFTVTLSRASSRTVTVDYATSDGSAQAGSDYTAKTGKLTFNTGDTSQTVSVTVLTDSDDEGQETLTLTISNPSQATLDDATGTGAIENGESTVPQDDPPAEDPVVLVTASFSNMPATHNGSEFTFELDFSENVQAGYARIRDHAFTITGGDTTNRPEITSAVRKVQGSNQGWTITVNPNGSADITITLPETTDCNATGAICTDDERKLSNSTEAQVTGPQ